MGSDVSMPGKGWQGKNYGQGSLEGCFPADVFHGFQGQEFLQFNLTSLSLIVAEWHSCSPTISV